MPALAASTWNVNVGAQTSDAAVQVNGFFNNNITIDAGDTVKWNWNTEEIHTVTFGTPPPPGNLFFVDPGVSITPGPGFIAVGNGTSYTGGFASSGVMARPVPPAAPPAPFTLTFPNVGTYSYVCLVHEGMKGTVTVNPEGFPYPTTPAGYEKLSMVDISRLLTLGSNGLVNRALGQANPSDVSAGVGQLANKIGAVAVLRFEPNTRVVHVGDTVTWTDLDPQTPHTVTFGTEPPGGPFGAFAPSSNVKNGHATISPGDSVNSGFIAKDPVFGASDKFSATFIAPGTYPYICALHDEQGMTGAITVLP
jgi:plastocyanin